MRCLQSVFAGTIVCCAASAMAQPLVFSTGIPGTFVDISGTGTALNLTDDGSAVIFPTVGNTIFPVDGNGITVSNNGGLGFGASVAGGTLLSPNNQPLPSPLAFGGRKALLTFWDDPGNDVGNVWTQEIMGVLYVQWTREFNGDPSMIPSTWQAQIDSAEAEEKYAQYFYRGIQRPFPDGGVIATIGFQAPDGAAQRTVQWSFNQSHAVNNSTVLTLTRNNCVADFNSDGMVDDSDFVVFAFQYENFVCPATGGPCQADINFDNFVDDSDFVIFAAAYEQFVCLP